MVKLGTLSSLDFNPAANASAWRPDDINAYLNVLGARSGVDPAP